MLRRCDKEVFVVAEQSRFFGSKHCENRAFPGPFSADCFHRKTSAWRRRLRSNVKETAGQHSLHEDEFSFVRNITTELARTVEEEDFIATLL